MNDTAASLVQTPPPDGTVALQTSWLRTLLLVLACFAILYNVSFKFNESLTSGRLTVLAMVLWLVVRGRPVYVPRDWSIALLFLPLPYVAVQALMTSDVGQVSRFVNLALYAYLGADIFARFCRDSETLLRVILTAVALQAVVILVSFFSMDYRLWFDSLVVWGNNFEIDDPYRAPGFASTGGSALSVVQALGVLAGGMLLRLRGQSGTRRGAFPVIALMVLCALSCVVVGRTGLVLSMVFFALFSVAAGVVGRAVLLVAGLAGIAAAVLPQLDTLLPAGFSSDFFVQWAFGFLVSGSDASVTDVQAMPIPPLGLDTFFGTGLVTPTNAGNPSGHDSGFVQAYFSMGLVGAAVFYAIYAFVLLRLLRWLPLGLRLALAVTFFLLEVKEPFLFKYASMFVLVALYTLAAGRAIASGRARV